jgi:hypothetical protein
MALQLHQYRVLTERDDLASKTEKLEVFTGSERFRSLDTHEQARLVRQLNHMRGYLQALNERIAAFGPAMVEFKGAPEMGQFAVEGMSPASSERAEAVHVRNVATGERLTFLPENTIPAAPQQ